MAKKKARRFNIPSIKMLAERSNNNFLTYLKDADGNVHEVSRHAKLDSAIKKARIHNNFTRDTICVIERFTQELYLSLKIKMYRDNMDKDSSSRSKGRANK